MTVQQFKKNNKVARERIAIKLGYPNAAAYLTFLSGYLTGVDPYAQGKKSTGRARIYKKKVSTELKTVHNVHVLDVSGSMNERPSFSGPTKLEVALKGINAEIEALKSDDTVKYTNTLICFNIGNPVTKAYMIPMKEMGIVHTNAGGGTALHDAIGDTITRLRASKKYDENVIIKVFTDGEENSSRKYRASQIRELISEVENEGITVAFVGTSAEVAFAVNNYGVHASNTFMHQNTLDSVNTSFDMMRGSTMSYSAKLSKGLDVKKGFFKKTGKL